ncbi:Uncharacterized protein APZ42_000580 [Daphnia magna]|uniref:Uncharacterized protein n=1 Tax=Daphnia magna TaxID=35525 RepID=A0A164JIZ2_9CRUS|nr:Uncharacterized protein APZ42_000580 [Daphnia magna]
MIRTSSGTNVLSHITQGSPSGVRQMSGSDVEYIFLISSGQPDIRFGCPMDVFFFVCLTARNSAARHSKDIRTGFHLAINMTCI